jgi:hypothetical protein
MVAVLDAEATVIKSDNAISPELRQALIQGVFPLEDLPENQKDWHPGSNDMVLDLLHPSLFPLVYGTTRILPHGTVLLQNCASYTGMGDILIGPGDDTTAADTAPINGRCSGLTAWGKYQWLPSDVHFTEAGKVKIASYINNLHPDSYGGLYNALEQCVEQSIPLWNEALSWWHSRMRIPMKLIGGSDEDYMIPEGVVYPGRSHNTSQSDLNANTDSEDSEDYDDDADLEYDEEYREWKRANRVLIQVEPIPFQTLAETLETKPNGAIPIDLREKYRESGLQIIFKLANIHLTPDKSEYGGGSWHVEGALNEHICATALYYYDEENISENCLGFRQSVSEDEMISKPMQVRKALQL